ncbi:hypothetical protein BGZ72_005771 [Mortierella alpina]|nr:hypothetical protein BGZ72_005771 [Mortierella alpina]
MTLANGHANPFEIVELCALIASHLTQHDCAQLCCVSKHFSQLFRSFVWRKVVLRGGTDPSGVPSVLALASNGLLIQHVELLSRCTRSRYNESEGNAALNAHGLRDDYSALATRLLIFCGSNLTTLKVVDQSDDGEIWRVVMTRIQPMKGIPLLNRIQVLDIILTYTTLDTDFRRLLTDAKYPGAAVAFAGVKELGLYGIEPSSGRYVSEEEEHSRAMRGPIKFQFRDLMRLFPALQKLTLQNINIEESLDDVEAAPSQSAAVATAPLGCYQFHTLNFEECGISAQQIVQILKRTHHVRSLKIGSSASLMGDVGVLINSLPTLTPLLTEYGQEDVEVPGISTLFKGLPQLTRLDISMESLFVDTDLEILAEACPGLQHLILKYCATVTYRGVHHILRSCTRLETLKLPASPLAWGIFGSQSPEVPSTPSADSTTTVSPSPAELIPWACQDTLQHLLLTLMDDNPPEYLYAARQRLQSLSKLHNLELRCHNLPVAMLMDLEQLEGSPQILYPALQTLELSKFDPPLTIDMMSKLARCFPKLKQARHKNYFDTTLHVWRLDELLTMV